MPDHHLPQTHVIALKLMECLHFALEIAELPDKPEFVVKDMHSAHVFSHRILWAFEWFKEYREVLHFSGPHLDGVLFKRGYRFEGTRCGSAHQAVAVFARVVFRAVCGALRGERGPIPLLDNVDMFEDMRVLRFDWDRVRDAALNAATSRAAWDLMVDADMEFAEACRVVLAREPELERVLSFPFESMSRSVQEKATETEWTAQRIHEQFRVPIKTVYSWQAKERKEPRLVCAGYTITGERRFTHPSVLACVEAHRQRRRKRESKEHSSP